LTLEISHQYFS